MWHFWLHLGTFQPICDSKRKNLSYLNRIIFTGECQYRQKWYFTSCLSPHDKSHHVKITQLKSDGSNWVRKRAKKGAETVPKPILAHINILALHRQSDMLSYWAISEHLFIANILVLLVIGLYQFQPLTPSLLRDGRSAAIGTVHARAGR